jgi:hypothetical protein
MKSRSLLLLSILGLAVGLHAADLAPAPAASAKPEFAELAGEGQTDYASYNKVVHAWSEAKAQIAQLTKDKEELAAQLLQTQQAFAILRQQRNELAAQVLDLNGQQAMRPATPPPSTPNK